ncbi:MAG: phospho-N-acetylmuramoyl-pentapeptide-transferase [Bacillota bacterium]
MAFDIVLILLITLFLTVIVTPFYIRGMRSLQFGQQIREDGPALHAIKAGTPTMGGVIFIPAAALVTLIIAGPSPALHAAFLVTLGCGLIGLFDDLGKIALSRSLGLKARSKLAGEVLITALLVLILHHSGLYSTAVEVPFLGVTIDLGYFYPLFLFLIISAASNSVNLTDGIDGLASGVSVIALVAFMVIALQAGSFPVVLFCAAMAGGCLGFLFFNCYPARLFMGDTGSLALGGAFAAIAVLLKAELFLIIIGGIFVLEALSVIIQVIWFRLTGRRILLMSPLHHHFEMKGWSEWRVVGTFWGTSIILALAGVLAYNR